MSWYRKNPLFAIGITVILLVVLAEGALIYERWAASREMAKKLEQRKAELQGMAQLAPPPTSEIATAIAADLAKAQRTLEAMQGELKGRGPAAERLRSAKLPAARTDAYFDLATFVERMRDAARKNEVDVRPEAVRFGFAAFANEGPVQDHIEPVFRQRQIAQYLLEALIEAKPRALLAVHRERTFSKAEREARAQALANGEILTEPASGDGPDYFVLDPRMTARVQGYLDTIAFRFVFTGQTAALRTFLNRLASFELPVLVREVEVDVASAEEAAVQAAAAEEAATAELAGASAATASSVVLSVEGNASNPNPPKPAPARSPAAGGPRSATNTPIVTRQLSKFTVTVEFIEIVPPAAPVDPNAPPPPPS